MDAEREQILESIDNATHPDKMKPKEAIDFLEMLSSDIVGRIEALKDENDL